MDGPSYEQCRTEAVGNDRPREMVIAHSWVQNPAYRRAPQRDRNRWGGLRVPANVGS